jgi:hypothetical protein
MSEIKVDGADAGYDAGTPPFSKYTSIANDSDIDDAASKVAPAAPAPKATVVGATNALSGTIGVDDGVVENGVVDFGGVPFVRTFGAG